MVRLVSLVIIACAALGVARRIDVQLGKRWHAARNYRRRAETCHQATGRGGRGRIDGGRIRRVGGRAERVLPAAGTHRADVSGHAVRREVCHPNLHVDGLRPRAPQEVDCDKHLVELLVKPLRYFRPLVLPGIVLVAFVVNIPLISQASTAVAAGIVLIPLARAAGLAPITIGAALVLGCSIGGELLNPGAPELRTIVESLRMRVNGSESCLTPVEAQSAGTWQQQRSGILAAEPPPAGGGHRRDRQPRRPRQR